MPTLLDRARTGFAKLIAPNIKPSVPNPREWSRDYNSNRTYAKGFLGRIQVNSDQLLLTKAGGNLDLWRSILDDDQAFATFQQRRLAVIDKTWEVEPGGEAEADVKAADFIRTQLDNVGWDAVCNKMLFASWYGYGVAEAIYGYDKTLNLVTLDRIDVPDRGWFGFDAEGVLRIKSTTGFENVDLPDNKFWVARHGNDHDFQPYGVGLAHWVYWPVYFKRNVMPFWLRFLEKFGSPTVLGHATGGQLDDPTQKTAVLAALAAVSSESTVALPDWMKAELLQVGGSGANSYEAMCKRLDMSITRVILSQTMTTEAGPAGLGSGQANEHGDVRDTLVKSDSDMLHESFNRSIVRWLVDWNFPGAAYPTVYRVMDDEESLDVVAERDGKLKALGWERTEDSFHEVYGEGYEKAEPLDVDPLTGLPRPPAPGGKPKPKPVGQTDDDDSKFSAADDDDIDKLVALMADDSDAMIRTFAASIKDKLEGIKNPEIARIALLEWLERQPAGAFAEFMAKAQIAARAATEAGIPLDKVTA